MEDVVGVSDLTGPDFGTHFADWESVAVGYVVGVGHVFFECWGGVWEEGIPDPVVEAVAWFEIAVWAGDGVALGWC